MRNLAGLGAFLRVPILVLCAMVMVTVAITPQAFAQAVVQAPAPAPVADPGFFQGYVWPAILSGISGLMGWAVITGIRFFNIKMEDSRREALTTALTNAAALVAERGMRFAIDYVKKSAPDAVKKFGLDDVSLAPKIEAKAVQLEAIKAAPPPVAAAKSG